MRATPKLTGGALVFGLSAPTSVFKKTNDVTGMCAKRVRAPIQASAHRHGATCVVHKEST
jgi:hypothetical protein